MRIILLILSISILPFSARSAVCGAGYYNNNGTCVKCESYTDYYCPGNDEMVPCPTPTEDFAALANSAFGESTIIRTRGPFSYSSGLVGSTYCCYMDIFIGTVGGELFIEDNYGSGQSYWNLDQQFWYKANPGYYLSGYRGWTPYYTGVSQCQNTPPAHAQWANETEPDNPNCTWECVSGFGRTSNNTCEQLCTAGVTGLYTSTGLRFNLYANKQTSPAIHIMPDGTNTVCYANLAPGVANNAVNVDYNGAVYHSID